MVSKTGFEKYFARKMKSAEFAAAYDAARSVLDATDQIVRTMVAARVEFGMSKAELARRIGATVRKCWVRQPRVHGSVGSDGAASREYRTRAGGTRRRPRRRP